MSTQLTAAQLAKAASAAADAALSLKVFADSCALLSDAMTRWKVTLPPIKPTGKPKDYKVISHHIKLNNSI